MLLNNGSTDDSVERALRYDRVTVLRCELPYRWFRTAMRRYLVETYGDGGWALLVDVDELWDYPLSDRPAVRGFLRYLNAHSFTAAAAQMLDLFRQGRSMVGRMRVRSWFRRRRGSPCPTCASRTCRRPR